MRIALIETGAPPKELARRFGSYPEMMERMLAPLSARFSFFTVRVAAGDPCPALDAFGGALLTGSAAGAYEEHAWIARLEDFVRRTAAAGKPQVGVCFGHQLMAQAFGGKVEKSDKGWGVGVHRYEIVDGRAWMSPSAGSIACAVSHQDQVVEAPAGARTLAASDFCPLGALAYAQGPAISFQMHPEFEHDYAASLITMRFDRVKKSVAEDALSSLKARSDRAVMAQWIANFFISARGSS